MTMYFIIMYHFRLSIDLKHVLFLKAPGWLLNMDQFIPADEGFDSDESFDEDSDPYEGVCVCDPDDCICDDEGLGEMLDVWEDHWLQLYPDSDIYDIPNYTSFIVYFVLDFLR